MNKLEREENLVAAFSFFDKDASGYITIEELQQAWKEFGINDSNLDEMIKDIDQDNVSSTQMIFTVCLMKSLEEMFMVVAFFL